MDDIKNVVACMVHGNSVSSAGTVRNSSSRSGKSVVGMSPGLTVTTVDVSNNSLDVLLNAASSAGPWSVVKGLDEKYFHGYVWHEHSVGSAARAITSVTGSLSSKELVSKASYLMVAAPSRSSAGASVVLTGAKSRTSCPNKITG